MSILDRLLDGARPDAARSVSERLLRRVFALRLEDGREVFVKQHLFPVLRVRLRYLLRSAPSAREARCLVAAARRGLQVPVVVGERHRRGLLGPRLAVLVTEALPVLREANHVERLRAVHELVRAGVRHPDLHPGNVLVLEDGGLGFVDLQSVRLCRAPLPLAAARRMAAKAAHAAWRELGPAGAAEVLAEAGFVPAELMPRLERLEAGALASRRRHALRSSSRFVRERVGLLGRRVRWRGTPLPPRADAGPDGPGGQAPLRGAESVPEVGVVARCWSPEVLRFSARGPRLRRLWIAAALSAEGPDPTFLAYERDAPWPWAREHLYIRAPRDAGGEIDVSACWRRSSSRSLQQRD